jgi:hypothetical protein
MGNAMPDTAATVYPYRRKLDGSLDLICLNCLATIATVKKHEIETAANKHICKPLIPSLAN